MYTKGLQVDIGKMIVTTVVNSSYITIRKSDHTIIFERALRKPGWGDKQHRKLAEAITNLEIAIKEICS